MRILSIDGGGIRGIIPGQILVELEKELKRKSGDDNTRIADCFDLIAGTSTGGILACIYLCPDPHNLNRPRFSAQEAVDLYLENGDEIFDIGLWHKIASLGGLADEKYSADGLEDALEDYFGELRLSQLLKPCLITAYDIRRRRAHFFTQDDAKRHPSADFLLKDVARATSAAPTFFETARIKSGSNIPYPLIDGGLFANNPTMCAYAEARSLSGNPKAADMAILSLGTGNVEKPYYYKEAKDWGPVKWLKPVLDIMMSGVSETVDFQLGQIYDAVGKPERYLRINVDMSKVPPGVTSDMDNASKENMTGLRELGAEAAQDNQAKLQKFAALLLDEAPGTRSSTKKKEPRRGARRSPEIHP